MQRDLAAEPRRQIEACLRRSLSEDELVRVSSLNVLSAPQRTVLDKLARQDRLAAWQYVESVVANVTSHEAMPIIDRIHECADISSDDVLLLRPKFELDPQRIEKALEAMPGAFAHPTMPERCVLPDVASMAHRIRTSMIEHPDELTFTTWVRRHADPTSIMVVPGSSDGRARKFVETLLEMGPFELEVRGRVRGIVTSPLDIYGCAPWEDPDVSADPTESPPRTGTLVTFYRDAGSNVSEQFAIHDSGIVSYEQRRPVEDAEKTYRRIAPSHGALVMQLIAGLPFLEEGGAGPDGAYVDPAYIRFETPTGDGADADVKLDATSPSLEALPFVRLVDEWVQAMRRDRRAVLPGLEVCDTSSSRTGLTAPSLPLGERPPK